MRKVFLLVAALATAAQVLGAMSVKGTAVYQKEALRIDRDGQGYHLVRLAGAGHSDVPGAPQLPVDRRYLPLPAGAVADSVKVITIKSENIDGSYLVFPAQPQAVLSNPSPRTEFTLPDKRIYQAKGLSPAIVCELRGSGSLAGSVMAGLLIYPVQYQPATGKMELITSI
ncbi:MAG: C25 family peptidase propeptide domain-containing protein, partial [Deltaproteobacteria bacterium]|nr:C25 family peptidase propeptide domain-containing protein [Deltaproteobacteria bacterium]